MIKGFAATLLLLLAVSCAKEAVVDPLPAEPESGNPHFVSYEEALVGLNDLMASIDGQQATLGSQPKRAIASYYVHSFVTPTTLSDGEESGEQISTDVYVVNFEDEQGFAILASDERLPGVFALAESGSLDLSQPIENPGVEIFVTGLEDYIQVMAGGIGDSLMPPPETPYADGIYYLEWEYRNQIGPVIAAKWGQGNPYNQLCPLKGGEYPAAGCVAVAVAQIMYRWGAPNSYNGYSFNWGEMRKHLYHNPYNNNLSAQYSYAPAHDMIARLIEQLGTTQNLHMHYGYGLDGSGAKSENVPRTFRNFGYSSGSLQTYNATAILNSLNLNQPVYVRGEDPEGGHAWVIDAAIPRQQKVITVENAKIIRTSYVAGAPLVHCNWGWDGSDDGYYLNAAFDLINDPELTAPEDFTGNNSNSYDLRYDLKIITDIHP